MKLDYLRLCSRASDNPGFIWSRENGCVFFLVRSGGRGGAAFGSAGLRPHRAKGGVPSAPATNQKKSATVLAGPNETWTI